MCAGWPVENATGDVIDLILADHRRIRRLAAALHKAACGASGPWTARTLVGTLDHLAGLLEMHTSAEDEICYMPMFGTIDRAGWLEEALADHADIREAADEARLQPPGSPPWWRAVKAATSGAADHMSREEAGVLAAFARRAPAGLRQKLGRQWSAFCDAWPRQDPTRPR